MLHLSFRRAHEHPVYAYAAILQRFYTAHNFTFDTRNCPTEGGGYAKRLQGMIHAERAYPCEDSYAWYYVSPMVLSRFGSYCTLSFSMPVQPGSFKLFSLASPLLLTPLHHSY